MSKRTPTLTTCGHPDRPHFAKGMCKRCYRKIPEYQSQQKAYREANRERIRARNKAWWKANPEKARAKQKARYDADPEKARARNKAYREAHPETVRARHRAWQIANPEKARAKNGRRRAVLAGARRCDLTPAHWRAIKAQFGQACFYCGKPEAEFEGPVTQDHMTPLTPPFEVLVPEGYVDVAHGDHSAYNVVPACGPCNDSKCNKTAEEFLGLVWE